MISNATRHNTSMPKWITLFGPGLLLASAAIGVSHIVQSTRAGAEYGLLVAGLVILAGLIKYPSFRAGGLYPAVTGKSLLHAYRTQGNWVILFFTLLFAIGLFTLQAGVTMVAAALVSAVTDTTLSITAVATLYTLISIAIISIGAYQLLDYVNKALVVVFTVTTVIAIILIIPHVSWASLMPNYSFSELGKQDLLFAVALMGWMPTAIELSVWHSLWCKAHRVEAVRTLKETLLDFDVGYVVTILLAVGFVYLGASTEYVADVALPASPVAFVNQFFTLYTQTLGAWSAPIVAVCSIAVMFSTVLVVIDAQPRVVHALFYQYRYMLQGDHTSETIPTLPTHLFILIAVVMGAGSIYLISMSSGSLLKMVDFATTVSFLTAPFLAWFNHRAIHSPQVAEHYVPSKGYTLISWVCIFTLFAAACLEVAVLLSFI